MTDIEHARSNQRVEEWRDKLALGELLTDQCVHSVIQPVSFFPKEKENEEKIDKKIII